MFWLVPALCRVSALHECTVLVVRAAMLDSRLAGALPAAAKSEGAKVILAGDDRQLASVERGGLFIALRPATWGSRDHRGDAPGGRLAVPSGARPGRGPVRLGDAGVRSARRGDVGCRETRRRHGPPWSNAGRRTRRRTRRRAGSCLRTRTSKWAGCPPSCARRGGSGGTCKGLPRSVCRPGARVALDKLVKREGMDERRGEDVPRARTTRGAARQGRLVRVCPQAGAGRVERAAGTLPSRLERIGEAASRAERAYRGSVDGSARQTRPASRGCPQRPTRRLAPCAPRRTIRCVASRAEERASGLRPSWARAGQQ